MANTKGHIVDRSHSGGRSIAEHWAFLFQRNEVLWAQHLEDVRIGFSPGARIVPLDDQDISVAMARAFPNRRSAIFREVNRVRSRYNRGALDGQKGAVPKWRSYRYALYGPGQYRRVSARGRLLGEDRQQPHPFPKEELEQILEELRRTLEL